MADALARLMADADLRRRLAEAGRQLVTARHSVQAHRRALVRLYSELAGKGSTEPRP
jgi:glycosyltransferase involved in cell wall biosynthesis